MKIEADPAKHKLTSARDARLRFNQTVVTGKKTGKPFYLKVGEDDYGLEVRAYKFLGIEEGFASRGNKHHIDKFETNNFELGWFQIAGNPYYVSRQAFRRYKQGLDGSNTTIFYMSYDKEDKPVCRTDGGASASYIAESLMTTKQRVTRLKFDKNLYVLSKNVLLYRPSKQKSYYVFYGTERIGTFNPERNEIQLVDDGLFSVYSEEFIELGIN